MARRRGSGALGHRLHHLASVDSTQDHLRRLAVAGAPHGTVVWAEEQTRGRGRRGNRWEARPGEALLVSTLVRSTKLPHVGGALSLVWALAARGVLARTLDPNAAERLAVKWPNDLLLGGRKLMGILVEGLAPGDGAIVGAGLNLALPPSAPADRAALGAGVDRVELLDALLTAWEEASRVVLEVGFGPFQPLYRAVLAYRAEQVALVTPAGVVRGRVRDVDAKGRLVLDTADGRAAFWAGEVQRLRPQRVDAPGEEPLEPA